ncbi:helix-turn-helix domain-containing protein [Actinoplanes sp. NPDC023801]|uniref:TetR/AcrR family transcriptional regulator n=1 Tax=Actinoplanes sp. NPDC023801 TaxID=3154595 RepID=UPI0033F41531
MRPETEPMPGRREIKRRQTRLALITAALRLADERGVDRVTVDEISAAAEVSPRTFFNYFATKEHALVGDPLEDCPAPVLKDLPLLEALLDALAPAFEQIEHDRDLWLLRMRVIAANQQLIPLLIAAAASAEQRLAQAIAEQTGLAPDHVRPQVMAAVVNAAVRVAVVRWAECGDSRPLTEHVREAFHHLKEVDDRRRT